MTQQTETDTRPTTPAQDRRALTDAELDQVTAAGGTGVRVGSDGANN